MLIDDDDRKHGRREERVRHCLLYMNHYNRKSPMPSENRVSFRWKSRPKFDPVFELEPLGKKSVALLLSLSPRPEVLLTCDNSPPYGNEEFLLQYNFIFHSVSDKIGTIPTGVKNNSSEKIKWDRSFLLLFFEP